MGKIYFLKLTRTNSKIYQKTHFQSKLIPYPDGQPKRSVFCSIYRALEKTPLAAIKKNLYLSTDDGKVLELYSSDYIEIESDESHLYQQFISRNNSCCK